MPTKDRDIEWPWFKQRIPNIKNAHAFELGPGNSPLGNHAAKAGFKVLSLDIRDLKRENHNNLKLVIGDILTYKLEKKYKLVINCSSVEHIGLPGRYNNNKSTENGDLRAMAKLRNCIVPGGYMLMSVPIGVDKTYGSLHRVYGPERLPKLIDGYNIAEEEFWARPTGKQHFKKVSKEEALAYDTTERNYAIGCFMLYVGD